MQMHAHMIMLIPRLQCSNGWLQVACCKPTPTEIGWSSEAVSNATGASEYVIAISVTSQVS